MKYIVGVAVILIVLMGTVLGIVSLWDMFLVSWDLAWKAGFCIVIFIAFIAFCVFVAKVFFKKGGLESNSSQ
ncbi:hypothetical protein ACYSNM_09520 [Myroides sp. LJL116]